MKAINSSLLRRRLYKICDEMEQTKESYLILRYGKPLAFFQPLSDEEASRYANVSIKYAS